MKLPGIIKSVPLLIALATPACEYKPEDLTQLTCDEIRGKVKDLEIRQRKCLGAPIGGAGCVDKLESEKEKLEKISEDKNCK